MLVDGTELTHSAVRQMRWTDDGKPELIDMLEGYGVAIPPKAPPTLSKYQRRALLALMDGPESYSLLAQRISGVRGRLVGTHRWYRITKAVTILWGHGMIRTSKHSENIVQLTLEGWVVAKGLQDGTWPPT